MSRNNWPFGGKIAESSAQTRFLDTPPIFIYIDIREMPMKPLHMEACLIYVKSDYHNSKGK